MAVLVQSTGHEKIPAGDGGVVRFRGNVYYQMG
jgi:hypothetical protein